MRYCLILFICLFLFACGGQTKEELLQEGREHSASGNYRGAIVLYKNALEKDVNYLEARSGLAEAYLNSGNYDRAEKEFQKVLLQNPSVAEIHLKLATVYLQQRQAEKAIQSIDKYHSKMPESAESLNLYGRAHGFSGDLESAENLFNKALMIDAKAIQPRLNLTKVFLQKKDYSRAKQYLQDIIALDGGQVEAYYMLASIESRLGHREEALKVYQDLVKVKPGEIQAHYMSGLLYMDLGDSDSAMKVVETITSKFPGRTEGSRLKGILLYNQQDYDGAKVALETSLQKEQHLLAYFFLGLSYYGLEQYELALNQYQKALDINPDFERARILVAMTLLKQKRVDDAITEVQKVVRKNPENAYAHNILGSALLSKGEYDAGMTELQLATELDPTLADAHLKRGVFHLSKGQGAQGESDLIKAVAAAPEILDGRLMLVAHYLRQKNYTEAIKILREGMDGTKKDALLNNYLAAAYFSQKNAQGAIEALTRAKEINPDYFTPYFNLASYYASQSEYDKAIEQYQQVLARDEKNLKALLGIAALYNVQGRTDDLAKTYNQIEATGLENGFVSAATYQLKLGNHKDALAIIERGLAKHSSSAALVELLGGTYHQLNQLSEAESAYTRLTGIVPERGNNLLFKLYILSRQTEKADNLISVLLKTNPDKVYPYLLSSRLFLVKKDSNSAVSILKEGVTKVQNSVRLEMQLARIHENRGEGEQAKQYYQGIIEREPRYSPAYAALGIIKEQSGNKGEALELYRTSLKYDRNNVPALNNLAYLLMDNFGQKEEALNYAMRAFQLQSNDPRIMDTLGYALLKNERAKDADNLLTKARELMPDVQAINLHLAMAKKDQGLISEAKKLLNLVIDKGNKEEVQQASTLLKSL